MDPISAAGLALSVASIGLQVYTGCVQGIQLIITAVNFPEECKYLNLRLRMEQQRLFAWSETSGLLDLDASNSAKVLQSNTFLLHRSTVLDLLMQVQCLFKEFEEHARRNSRLKPAANRDDDAALQQPEKDAAAANFPLPERRRNFIRKAMAALRDKSKEGVLRLRWVSFDQASFELLLGRFAALNDNMTDILDARLQVEIHHTVQDTNRGVLQLHHRIADLGRLVMALNVKLESVATSAAAPAATPAAAAQRAANADGLQLLSQLAKFKAFNESIEASTEKRRPWDEATATCLGLEGPDDHHKADDRLQLDRSLIAIDPSADESDVPRCEAIMALPGGGPGRRVWVEWKDYDRARPDDPSPPKDVILARVRKLAALLHHSPKPSAFRTPHCLGFFDAAAGRGTGGGGDGDEDEEDIRNLRLGLVFARPSDPGVHPTLPPVSLRELLTAGSTPRLTERVALARAVANCLLYLHAVNWLHKGLRSANVVFFRRAADGSVDLAAPYLSGFDFSRPARSDEMTDAPGADDAAADLYRHPQAQTTSPAAAAAAAGSGIRERFRKSFDIYSLGVLLVEIAHWAPLETVLGLGSSGQGGATATRASVALRVRERLLADEALAGLGARMGEIYEGAARRCIAGGRELGIAEGDDETQDAVAARLSVAFYEDVVTRLGDIKA